MYIRFSFLPHSRSVKMTSCSKEYLYTTSELLFWKEVLVFEKLQKFEIRFYLAERTLVIRYSCVEVKALGKIPKASSSLRSSTRLWP